MVYALSNYRLAVDWNQMERGVGVDKEVCNSVCVLNSCLRGCVELGLTWLGHVPSQKFECQTRPHKPGNLLSLCAVYKTESTMRMSRTVDLFGLAEFVRVFPGSSPLSQPGGLE
jgi:hypothetical protein